MQDCDAIPSLWQKLLPEGIADEPLRLVAEERRSGKVVYPPRCSVFRSLELTAPEKVCAVILGQDPYHEEKQATGLAFAVSRQCKKLPPSLKNILKELRADVGVVAPGVDAFPDLTLWARQGVLMLNTCLSVRKGEAFSHAKFGWQRVTDAIISAVSENCRPSVFLLWGAPAQAKIPLIDEKKHFVICSAHPSPLSAYRGFFGSKPFSRTNDWLESVNRTKINWNLY